MSEASAELVAGTDEKRPRGLRAIVVLLVFALCILFWCAGLICWGATSLPRPRAVAPIGPAGGTGRAKIPSSAYTQPEVCSDCHWDLFNQWKGTMHSFATTDPVYSALYQMADKETKGKAEQYCAGSLCHTPVGNLAGEVPPVDGSKLSPVSRRAVFCDFCHTVKGATGVGNGRYVPDPGEVKRGPYADAVSPFHSTAYSRLHTTSEFCGLCHQVVHPVYKTVLENTYEEWKGSPYNSRDPRRRRDCQDCHMAPKYPEPGPQPGKAALAAKPRGNIYSHDVAGANTFVNGLLGDTSKSPRATTFLRSAARLGVSARRSGADALIDVRVTNVGAGHYLPTGVTEIRQMWVEVKVEGADGRVLTSRGMLTPTGEIPKGVRIFHTVFADPSGKPTEHVWFASKLISDDRIPPKASRTVSYRIPGGELGRAPVRVTARLLYRTMPQYLADLALGPKRKAQVPVVEMAKAVAPLR